MTGNLIIEKNTPVVLLRDTTNGSDAMLYNADDYLYMQSRNVAGSDSNKRALMLANSDGRGLKEAIRLFDFVNGTVAAYTILHTGNKPSGSYTGNGDATERVIETGGIGRWLAIVNNSTGGWALVNTWGGVVAESGSLRAFNRSEAYYDGALYLKTDNSSLNGSGKNVFYQVL